MKKHIPAIGLFIAMIFNTGASYSELIRTSFSIYPIDVSTTIKTRRTVSYSLTNIKDMPIIIHVTSDFLRVGKYGKIADSPYQKDQMLAEYDDQQFALQNVRVSEPYVIIRPRQSKIVRVSFSIPPNAVPGTYRANIIFTPESNTYQENVWNQKTTASDNLGINIHYVLAQEVSIYANKGKGNAESASMTCRYDQQLEQFVLQIRNTSNWIFNPSVSIYSSSRETALTHTKIIPVMPQTQATRFISLSADQKKHSYYLMWALPNSEGHKVNCS